MSDQFDTLKARFKEDILSVVGKVVENVEAAEAWADTLSEDQARNVEGLRQAVIDDNVAEQQLYQGNLDMIESEMEGRVEELKFDAIDETERWIKDQTTAALKFGVKTAATMALGLM